MGALGVNYDTTAKVISIKLLQDFMYLRHAEQMLTVPYSKIFMRNNKLTYK